MRFLSLSLAAAMLAQPVHAQDTPVQAPVGGEADTRAAIAAVLAHQASMRGPESAAQTCVVPALAGPPVAAGEDNPMMPPNTVRIFFQWHVPEAPATVRPPPQFRPDGQRRRRERPPPVVLPAPVPADLAQRLDALRAEAARGGAAPAVAMVDEALVAPPMQLQDERDRGCAPLQLSAPAFAGDAAFVETAYACGTTCGNGSLYALQRREGRWAVVAVADTWIS
ncbi:MAG TPA: hypothetical protein VMG08_10185 [Allosphingosinicella sp.]|nr:hypothetical protein [Allosphingosinicella sp.]